MVDPSNALKSMCKHPTTLPQFPVVLKKKACTCDVFFLTYYCEFHCIETYLFLEYYCVTEETEITKKKKKRGEYEELILGISTV